MNTNSLSSLNRLTNEELLVEVERLAKSERDVTVALIAHLAVFGARRLHLAQGCSSLFTYCMQVLHLSEHAAYGRIQAARMARRFPVILEMLESGELNLTGVVLLAKVLSPENHVEILDAARSRSKREILKIVARVCPRPSVATSIRKLSQAKPAADVASTAAAASGA